MTHSPSPSESQKNADLRSHINSLCSGTDMSQSQSHSLFAGVMRGEVDHINLSALLVALKSKGETPAEIAGAARAMREAALVLDTGDMVVADSCGTGGDGAQTVNISTACALVAASAGVNIAKHGNRSISSRCGSADVLEACGLPIQLAPKAALECLTKHQFCFLYAPQYHAGVRHAMPVRRGLGVRTMFNLLGPLANPALPSHQLMGVYTPERCADLAETLGLLGCKRALVVHGGGLDEIALHAPTQASLLKDGQVHSFKITPEALGIDSAPISALKGGAPKDNALWLETLLAGKGSRAHNSAVAINAGALLWLCDRVESHRQGCEQALDVISEGRALNHLNALRSFAIGAD